MVWLFSILSGVVSGVIASFIFFLVTRQMRPEILISPQVSAYPNKEGNEVLRIKIVNTKRRPVSNLCVEIFVEHKEPADNGEVKIQTPVGVKFESSMLPPRIRRDTVFDNAVRVQIDRQKLIEALAKHVNGYMTVHVYAQDAISGVGAIFFGEYAPRLDQFRYGAFEVGDGMKISEYRGTTPYRLPEDLERATLNEHP